MREAVAEAASDVLVTIAILSLLAVLLVTGAVCFKQALKAVDRAEAEDHIADAGLSSNSLEPITNYMNTPNFPPPHHPGPVTVAVSQEACTVRVTFLDGGLLYVCGVAEVYVYPR